MAAACVECAEKSACIPPGSPAEASVRQTQVDVNAPLSNLDRPLRQSMKLERPDENYLGSIKTIAMIDALSEAMRTDVKACVT